MTRTKTAPPHWAGIETSPMRGSVISPRLGSRKRHPSRSRPPTRLTIWPGEDHTVENVEQVITDRDADFVQFVVDQVQAREASEDAFYASIDDHTGEVPN